MRALARRVFEAIGLCAVELCVAWLNPRRDIGSRVVVEGEEHLQRALASGCGVLLLGAHYAVLDAIARPLAASGPVDVMYRRNANPVWEWLQRRGRGHYFSGVIERRDLRTALQSLRAGRALWYAADQDYGPKHSVFADFFGMPAATITATARLARRTGAAVVPVDQHRDLSTRTWRLRFAPALEGFPSGDDLADARRINALIEARVREAPEQYLWLHRRFKTRPPGRPDLYA